MYLENCLLTSLLAPDERSPLKSVTLRTAASETRRVPGPRSVSATSPRPLAPHGTSEKSGEGAAGGAMLQCSVVLQVTMLQPPGNCQD